MKHIVQENQGIGIWGYVKMKDKYFWKKRVVKGEEFWNLFENEK